jgi:hypothetical protein
LNYVLGAKKGPAHFILSGRGGEIASNQGKLMMGFITPYIGRNATGRVRKPASFIVASPVNLEAREKLSVFDPTLCLLRSADELLGLTAVAGQHQDWA